MKFSSIEKIKILLSIGSFILYFYLTFIDMFRFLGLFLFILGGTQLALIYRNKIKKEITSDELTRLIDARAFQLSFIGTLIIIGFLQGGAFFSALMALFMDITNPKIGGTQYSILTSIGNLGDYSIGIVSGSLLVFFGYQRFFLYAAWVVGPALIVLYLVQEKWEK